jgi:tetratricopeptide (TPR) repeat protein
MNSDEFKRLWDVGRREEALAIAHAVLYEPDPASKQEMAEALVRCAQEIGLQNDPEKEVAIRVAVALRQAIWPPRHPHAPYAELALVDFLKQEKRWPEAGMVLQRCWERAEELDAHSSSEAMRDIAFEFARLYMGWGREADAECYLNRAIDLEEINRRSGRPPFTLLLAELQALYRRQGRFSEAAAIAEQRLAALMPSSARPSLDESELLGELGMLRRCEGRLEEALKAFEQALAIAEQAGGSEHSVVGRRCYDVGETLLRLDRPKEAVLMFERALKILGPLLGEIDLEIAMIRQRLAEASSGKAASKPTGWAEE